MEIMNASLLLTFWTDIRFLGCLCRSSYPLLFITSEPTQSPPRSTEVKHLKLVEIFHRTISLKWYPIFRMSLVWSICQWAKSLLRMVWFFWTTGTGIPRWLPRRGGWCWLGVRASGLCRQRGGCTFGNQRRPAGSLGQRQGCDITYDITMWYHTVISYMSIPWYHMWYHGVMWKNEYDITYDVPLFCLWFHMWYHSIFLWYHIIMISHCDIIMWHHMWYEFTSHDIHVWHHAMIS